MPADSVVHLEPLRAVSKLRCPNSALSRKLGSNSEPGSAPFAAGDFLVPGPIPAASNFLPRI
jgi:hypothetical protein